MVSVSSIWQKLWFFCVEKRAENCAEKCAENYARKRAENYARKRAERDTERDAGDRFIREWNFRLMKDFVIPIFQYSQEPAAKMAEPPEKDGKGVELAYKKNRKVKSQKSKVKNRKSKNKRESR